MMFCVAAWPATAPSATPVWPNSTKTWKRHCRFRLRNAARARARLEAAVDPVEVRSVVGNSPPVNAFSIAELVQTLFEEAGDALFLFHPETEQIVDTNPMAQRLSGYARQDLLRMEVTYLFRSEVQGGLHRLRQAFRNTGLFHSQDGFFLRHEKDGVWVPVNLTVTRLHAEPETLGLITAR